MSEWFYIWLAYGLTWVVLGGYALRLRGRQGAAERGLRHNGGHP